MYWEFIQEKFALGDRVYVHATKCIKPLPVILEYTVFWKGNMYLQFSPKLLCVFSLPLLLLTFTPSPLSLSHLSGHQTQLPISLSLSGQHPQSHECSPHRTENHIRLLSLSNAHLRHPGVSVAIP